LTSELGPGFREPSSTFKANPPPMPPVPAPPPLVAVRPTSFQICPTKDDRGLRYIPTVIKNLDGAAPHPLPKLPPKDERAPPGRTAVCFSGLLHTFSGPVANNIKKNVYSSLDNFDVFVVLPLSTRYATTEKIAEYFRPESPSHSFEVRFETEDLKMDDYHLDGFLYTNPHQQGRFLGQLKGLQNCWKVVDEHAKTTQTVYQWMMRMRPDVAYSHPIHFGPLIPDQAVVYTGYPLGYPRPEVPLCPGIDVGGDNLAFMPYDVARNYFNRLDFLRKPIAFKLKRRNPYVSDPHDVSNRWNAEDFMYRGLFALRGYVFVQHPYFPKHITCRNAVCDGWLAT